MKPARFLSIRIGGAIPLQPKRPRKSPVQARSRSTVEAILDATIQVLLDGGLDRLTTTRVAERAGVSIGTLYQYFPEKHALLAAVLERHLMQIAAAVEIACAGARNAPVRAIATAVVEAYFAAKMRDPAVSRALYAVAAVAGADALITRVAERAQNALLAALMSAPDLRVRSPELAAFLLTTIAIGPAQALIAADGAVEIPAGVVAGELIEMICAYLERSPMTPAARSPTAPVLPQS
jgi:AcrR family transcriptional regulator